MELQFDGMYENNDEHENFKGCQNCRKYVQLYYKSGFEYIEFCCGVCIQFHSMKYVVPFKDCKYFEPK